MPEIPRIQIQQAFALGWAFGRINARNLSDHELMLLHPELDIDLMAAWHEGNHDGQLSDTFRRERQGERT